jgi:predicted urease superfamily metal-dependent hydrolase
MEFKFKDRKSVSCKVGQHCYLSGESDFIEVTEWVNKDGVDITVLSHHQEERFTLTWGQAKLLNKLIKALKKA